MAKQPSPPTILILSLWESARLLKHAWDGEATVLVATDAEAALQLCAEHPPDVVLVSYLFDELRPYRVVRTLREDPCSSNAAIVLFRFLPLRSLRFDEDEVRQAYEDLGCTTCVDCYPELEERGLDAAIAKLKEAVAPHLRPPG